MKSEDSFGPSFSVSIRAKEGSLVIALPEDSSEELVLRYWNFLLSSKGKQASLNRLRVVEMSIKYQESSLPESS